MFSGITFAYSWILYFLILVPAVPIWYWLKGRQQQPSITYSSLKIFREIPATWREKFRHLPVILRTLALFLLIVALARPQSYNSGENIYTEGIDIAMVLDISGSMLAEDLKPNRIEAAKQVIDNFISNRTSDRIGLVIFARQAFTQCPLTIDYGVLRHLLSKVEPGMVEDGTAIGNAIADGVNRLKDGKAKSKIIILLTDGMNNAGEIDPLTAAQIAKTFGIRIYTVGVGAKGEAPYPVQTPFGIRYQMIPADIDEGMLQQIANITGGAYFRATDTRALQEIYDKIDRLEKSRVEVTSYRQAKELFYNWLGAGLVLIFLEIGLSQTIFRKVP
jgi:Ca-activated chloride channel family protein